jgi:hypothetical protein
MIDDKVIKIKCGDGFVEIGPVCPPISSVFFPATNNQIDSLKAKIDLSSVPNKTEGDIDDTPQST